MKKKQEAKIICPKCKTDVDKIIWSRIFECPKCKKKTRKFYN